jgi:hypothetical protein
VEASRLSIPVTGRAVGYGPGHSITIETFNALHRTQAGATGASIEMADDLQHVRQRPSRHEKKALTSEAVERKAKKARLQEDKVAADAALLQATYEDSVQKCPRCQKGFLTTGWFAQHTAQFCVDRAKALEERKRSRRVEMVCGALDAVALRENAERISKLREVNVRLTGCGKIGLGVEIQSDSCVVVALDADGLAFLSGRIEPGFILMAIGHQPVNGDTLKLLEENILVTSTLDLTFKRMLPPLPLHGIARAGIHKRVKHVMHFEQLQWLNVNVFADGRTLMREKTAAEAMKVFFRKRMRKDTMTPMWLDQDKISSWLCIRVKEEKDRRKTLNKEPKGAKAKAETSGTSNDKTNAKKRRHSSDSEAENKELPSSGSSSPSESSSEDEGGGNSTDGD